MNQPETELFGEFLDNLLCYIESPDASSTAQIENLYSVESALLLV